MSCLTPSVLASYEARLLEEPSLAATTAHLEACAGCRERRAKLQETLAHLAAPEKAPEIAPRASSWDAIATRIAAREPQLAVAIACIFCKGRLARIDAVYCAGCLAPHHGDCWDEHGACAACNVATRVRAEAPRAQPRRRSLARPLGAAFAFVLAGGTVAAWSQGLLARPPAIPLQPPAASPPPSSDPPVTAVPEAALESTAAVTTQADSPHALPGEYAAFIASGRKKGAAGDGPGALEDLTEAIDIEPSLPDAYYWRGMEYFSQAKVAEAIKDFEVAITRSGRFYEAYLALGRALEWADDDDRAASNYREVESAGDAPRELKARAIAARAHLLALKSNRVDVLSELDLNDRSEKAQKGGVPEKMALGELVAEGGAERARRADAARQLYREALDLDPYQPEALVGYARLAFATGVPEEAAPFIARAERALGGRRHELAEVKALEGELELSRKSWDRAIAAFESALAEDSKCAFAVAGLAHAYLGRDGERSADARGLFHLAHALRAAPADKELAFWTVECAKNVANAVCSKKVEAYAATRRSFVRLIEKDPFDASAYVKRGRAAAEWHDWDFALRDASAALEADPFCYEAHALRGLLLARDLPTARDPKTQRPLWIRDYALAKSECSLAIELLDDVEDLEPYLGLALALDGLGDRTGARNAIDQALARIPATLADHLDDLGFSVDRIVTAVECDAFAHRCVPPASRAFEPSLEKRAREAAKRANEQGKALRDKRAYAEAIACFDRAAALDPLLADALYDRGTCYLKIGNFVPGILDFSRALELNPRFADQFYNKVYQVSYVVDLNRVIHELNKIVADHPDLSYVIFLRGFFYVAKTEFKKYDKEDLRHGIEDLDRTLQLNPRHVSAYVYRGFLEYKAALITEGEERARNFDAALADYDKACELDPMSGIAHFLKAMVFSVRSEEGSELSGAAKHALREKAIEELTISIEQTEFKGFDRIKNDKGFAAVRNDPRVIELIRGK
jgi:tetratricopeptide (TPR) repeat protein